MAVTKQEFISNYVAGCRKTVITDPELLATIAANAPCDKYAKLFDCIAEVAYSGASMKLQAAVDDLVDDYLEKLAEREWVDSERG